MQAPVTQNDPGRLNSPRDDCASQLTVTAQRSSTFAADCEGNQLGGCMRWSPIQVMVWWVHIRPDSWIILNRPDCTRLHNVLVDSKMQSASNIVKGPSAQVINQERWRRNQKPKSFAPWHHPFSPMRVAPQMLPLGKHRCQRHGGLSDPVYTTLWWGTRSDVLVFSYNFPIIFLVSWGIKKSGVTAKGQFTNSRILGGTSATGCSGSDQQQGAGIADSRLLIVFPPPIELRKQEKFAIRWQRSGGQHLVMAGCKITTAKVVEMVVLRCTCKTCNVFLHKSAHTFSWILQFLQRWQDAITLGSPTSPEFAVWQPNFSARLCQVIGNSTSLNRKGTLMWAIPTVKGGIIYQTAVFGNVFAIVVAALLHFPDYLLSAICHFLYFSMIRFPCSTIQFPFCRFIIKSNLKIRIGH